MALLLIKPGDLPVATSVDTDAAVMVQNGEAVERASPQQVVDAGRPIASEAQAVTGTDNSTAMTPLTVRQAIDADTSGSVAQAIAAAEAAEASALDAESAEEQTGLDVLATAADRVQTGLDAAATAADRVQTGLDAAATAADATATAADRVQTGLDATATGADATATAADRVQTGLDAAATAADRVQTGLDAASAAASAALAGNATGVTFTQAGTGAVAQTVATKLGEVVSIKDFGAVGDGVADDTAAIQAAINSGFARVVSPAGQTYRITDTLTLDASGVELDFGHSTINLDDATGLLDHLFIGNGTTQRSGIRIRNITFTREQVATAGYAINTDRTGVMEISGCRIFGNNRIHGGIRLYRGIIINVFNNYIDNYIRWGLDLEGTGLLADRTVDVCIRENRIEGGVSALRTWDFVEGVFCRDNIFFNTSSSAADISASSGANGLVSFKFQENDFDTCGGSGMFIENVGNIQITGCWFSSITLDALQLKSGCNAAIVADNQIYPDTVGIRIECPDVRVNGNLVSGGTTAINIAGGTRVGIVGNTLQNCNVGVDLNSATAVNAVGNFFSGIATNEFQNVGTSAHIHKNYGDRAIGQNAFITVGASPFTYTAGVRPEYVSVFSGTVSEIRIGSNAIGLTTNAQVMLNPGQSMTVIYSSAPFMVYNIM